MNNVMKLGQNCEDALRCMDMYVDRELQEADAGRLMKHLESCPSCYEELELRRRLRSRLRTAASASPSPYLHTKVLAGVRAEAGKQRRRSWFGWQQSVTAAVAILGIAVVTVTAAYQIGYLRWSGQSQESYIQAISARVSSVMSVGLGDHVHCTVFGKRPKKEVDLAQTANELPSEYKGLLKEVADRIPKGFTVYKAHTCRYHKRAFYHIAMTKGNRLVSLVITRRQPGESFNATDVIASLDTSGIPVHSAGVQRYSISGIEARDHLAYFVSDLAPAENNRLMLALGPPIAGYLAKL
jgi:hypothetical protein